LKEKIFLPSKFLVVKASLDMAVIPFASVKSLLKIFMKMLIGSVVEWKRIANFYPSLSYLPV
jgi:hypothetical protein